MPKSVASPMETLLDRTFRRVSNTLNELGALAAKRDGDYINGDGNFAQIEQTHDRAKLSLGIKSFNENVLDPGLEDLATKMGIDPVSAVALSHAIRRHLRLTDWTPDRDRSNRSPQLPDITLDAPAARNAILGDIALTEHDVEWWTQQAEALVQLSTDKSKPSTVVVYPSKGAGNVQVEMGRIQYGMSYSKVLAKFSGGAQVTVHGEDENFGWIDLATEPDCTLTVPVAGFHDYQAVPGNARSVHQKYLRFPTAEHKMGRGISDGHRMAARVAIAELFGTDHAVLDYIRKPSDAYAQSAVDRLALASLEAFWAPNYASSIRRDLRSRTRRVTGVTTKEVPNLIKTLTLGSLASVLVSVGATADNIRDAADELLKQLKQSDHLGDRCNAIAVERQVHALMEVIS